jgi:hypothetical protein
LSHQFKALHRIGELHGKPTRFVDHCLQRSISLSQETLENPDQGKPLENHQDTLVIQISIVVSFIAYISNLDNSNLCNMSFKNSPNSFRFNMLQHHEQQVLCKAKILPREVYTREYWGLGWSNQPLKLSQAC